MLLVGTESLRPGMKLAMPVLHPDRADLLLLGDGFVLDGTTVVSLRAHGVTHAWIAFPGLEELDGQVSESVAKRHIELCKVLNQSIDHLERRVSVGVNVSHYRRAVHLMLADIVANATHDLIVNQLAMCGPRLAGHMANTCYMALVLGAHLSGYLRAQRRTLPAEVAENTAQLGLGALLHDVGKVNMTDELRTVGILDEQAAWSEYRCHVKIGYQQVRDYISPVAANIVLHHHQRFDGSGFPSFARSGARAPEPLGGQRIHVFSRIVGVVDVFDHLLCPHGKPVPTIAAISRLRDDRFAGWFDPVIVDALLHLVPPFMVGQALRLNDGREAVVIANHPEAPCRPTVKLLSAPVGASGARAESRPIDLRTSRSLGIAEVDGHDVRPFLFTGELEPQSTGAPVAPAPAEAA